MLCDYRGAEPGGHCRDHTRAAAPGGAAGKLLASTGAMAATAWCGYGFLSRHMGAGAATLLAILAAAVVYIVLVLALEVLRREEILQLPKGEKLAKFLYKS